MDLVGFPINRHLAAVPQRFPTATSHRLATLLSWGTLLRIVTADHDDDAFEDRASWFSTTTFHFYNGAESIDGDSGGTYLDICQSLLLVRLNITIAAARLLLAPIREEVAT